MTGAKTHDSESHAELFTVLDRQRELYARLGALAERQSAMIRGDESESLLALLAARQRLIDEIAQDEAYVESLRRDWEGVMATLPEPVRAQVRRRVEGLAEAAAGIAQRDAEDAAELARRRDSVGAELAGMSRKCGAVAAYGSVGRDRGPRFQDAEG